MESYEDLQNLKGMDPAQVDNSGFPITPIEALHPTIPVRVDVDIDDYTLLVDGRVERPLDLTYDDIVAYPPVTQVVLLICPGFFVDNAEWKGVPVASLLSEAAVEPEATSVTFYGLDVSYGANYSRTLPLDIVEQDGVFLAYEVNGETLPHEHGYPLRLVVKGNYGYDWVKWLGHIEVH